MSKDDKSSHDHSIKIGQGAAGSVINSGDGNVVTIAGANELPGGRRQGDVPKAFISSTSEDLKEHRAAARDAANAAAVCSGKATAELLGEVTRNVKRLDDFKNWINGLGIRAKFSNVQDLGWKVSQALADWKQRHVRPDPAASDKRSVQSQQPTFPPAYREWLLRQCADIDLVGLRF